VLATVHPTLNDHVSSMRPTYGVYIVWYHFDLEPSMSFHASHDLWPSLTLTLCSKNRKNENKEKLSSPFVNLTQDIIYIIVIIDTIPATKHIHIFDTFIHLYQLHSTAISNNLRDFFNKNSNNLISFWNYPSSNK